MARQRVRRRTRCSCKPQTKQPRCRRQCSTAIKVPAMHTLPGKRRRTTDPLTPTRPAVTTRTLISRRVHLHLRRPKLPRHRRPHHPHQASAPVPHARCAVVVMDTRLRGVGLGLDELEVVAVARCHTPPSGASSGWTAIRIHNHFTEIRQASGVEAGREYRM